MKASPFILHLILAGSLALLSIGCSTSRERVVLRQELPASRFPARSGDHFETVPPTSVATDEPASFDASQAVETVAYRHDQVVADASAKTDSDTGSDVNLPTSFEPNANWTTGLLTPEGITLELLEQLALRNNPSIQQVSAAAAKAAGVRAQVGLKPNPIVGYFGEEIGNERSSGLHGVFVSQTFVRGEKLAWNQQVLGHDVNSVMWQVEVQRRRVRTDIRISFYEALAAQNRLRLARDFHEIAEQGVSISKERVTAKVGTRPDILQSEIQLSEIDLAIQQANLEFDAAWNDLAAVAGLPDLAPTPLIGELNVLAGQRDVDTAYAQIVSESPLLASAMARVDRARANLQRQNVQPIPNLTARLGVGHDDSTGDEFANVQLSLPVPVHNKNQGNIQAAHAEFCEATQNVQRIRMQIRRDLARVMREYQVAQATVEQYETSILPKSEETLALMQEAKQAGEFDFLRVLTARRAYFDANLRYVTALAELAQANAKIDGLLLTGGLANIGPFMVGDGSRGQALSGQ